MTSTALPGLADGTGPLRAALVGPPAGSLNPVEDHAWTATLNPAADTLVVRGTPGDEAVRIRPGSAPKSWIVTVNGAAQTTPPNVSRIIVDGLEGNDSASFVGTDGDEVARLWPGGGAFKGDGWLISFSNVESVAVEAAGGNDAAHFYDSAGPDRFVARPGDVRLSGDGFLSRVLGFARVVAYAGPGGGDVAKLYADPLLADTFLGTDAYSKLSSAQASIRAIGFSRADCYASGEDDVARLYDNTAVRDTFVATPSCGKLSNSEVVVRAVGFRFVHAFSSGGDDLAKLYDDGEGRDVFVATPAEAKLCGAAFLNRAVGFSRVCAYGTGGEDVARLYDDSTGDDTFVATSDAAKLSSSEATLEAVGFRYVHAFSSGGEDAARLYDDPAGQDTLVATPTCARLFGAKASNRAVGFRRVQASSSGGEDVARLYDHPDERDGFVSTPTSSKLFNAGFSNRALGFPRTYAYSSGAGDAATFYDSEGDDTFVATPRYCQLTGEGFSNRALLFDRVYARASQGGHDQALLWDSGLNDLLEAAESWVKLSRNELDPEFVCQVFEFELVNAIATAGIDIQAVAPDVTGLDLQGNWRPRPKLPPHLYFEAEDFFSLEPASAELEGHFGDGYRVVGPAGARPVIDRTVHLPENPSGGGDYTVWVRAYTDPSHDRRVAAEWIGEESEGCSVLFAPTHHGAGDQGFRWERAGVVKGQSDHYYQLRLHAVDGSEPMVDAVLLTPDPDCRPKETVRPRDDPDFTGGDGEGTIRSNQQTLVAGSEVQLEFVYTVGPSGIAEGGALCFLVPAAWTPPQTEDAGALGFVTAATSQQGVRLETECWQPGRELKYQHECFARVVSGSLKSGDTITVSYAGHVQTYARRAVDFQPFAMWTDADADGVFWNVVFERSHRLEVVAGPPASFSVVVPSIVTVGEPLEIKVAALDPYRNLVTAYTGALSFSLVSLQSGSTIGDFSATSGTIEPDDQGWKHFDTESGIEAPGAYAIRVDDGHGVEGLSNPIRCETDEPAYRIVWGDLHGHQRRCDGARTFREVAAYARDVAGLDVVALSPHACYITDGDLADLWLVNEEFHEPDEFVPLFAYEWAGGGKGSPHSVLYSEEPMPFCFRAWGGGNVVQGRPALYDQLDQFQLDVVEVPHHVHNVTESDPQYQKAIEIYSQFGSHEAGVAANLDSGLRACLFGTSDNHTGHPGLQPVLDPSGRLQIGGLTAFLVPSLNRGELFDAIDARRCYATASARILADFQVNGHAMGEEFTAAVPEAARVIELEAVASTPIAEITLLRDGEPIQTWHPDACVAQVTYEDAEPVSGPSDYYYVRITCSDQEKAWLTPVWVDLE